MVERNTCNYSHPTWKLTFHTIKAKVSWITSWVPIYLLPWAQCKRWIPIGLMGCVHMHQMITTIERWSSPSHIQSVVEKTKEDNQKARKINWVVNQTLTLELEHDKTWTWWTSNIMSKNMLERVWWCKHSKMEFWNQTICCSMNCSNGKRHIRIRGGRRSMSPWGVARKGRCYCWCMLRLQ
jgi:hypothetical protein